MSVVVLAALCHQSIAGPLDQLPDVESLFLVFNIRCKDSGEAAPRGTDGLKMAEVGDGERDTSALMSRGKSGQEEGEEGSSPQGRGHQANQQEDTWLEQEPVGSDKRVLFDPIQLIMTRRHVG